MFPVRVPLARTWVRYGMVLFVAVSIFFSVVNPAVVGEESTEGMESYGPFGVDYGPLGWVESDTWAHGMTYAMFTAALAYAFVAPIRPTAVGSLWPSVSPLRSASAWNSFKGRFHTGE